MQPTYHTDIEDAKRAALELARLTQKPVTVALTLAAHTTDRFIAVPNKSDLQEHWNILHTVRPDGVIEG